MIRKNDLILLLTQMEAEGVDIGDQMERLMLADGIPMESLRFINSHRQLDLTKFYERVRHNYNTKRSDLYINIMKEDIEPQEVITTLCALLLQITLFSKHADNRTGFLEWSRAGEISKVLTTYFSSMDMQDALKMLRVIKTDIKALESFKTQN